MANIPVERKDRGGLPWWAWLLGLLALLALLLLLTRGCDNEDTAVVDDGTDTLSVVDDDVLDDSAPVTDTGAPVTALDELYDGDMAAGRTVNLTNARVLSVVGDSSFYVGTADDRRVLVVLEGLGEGASGESPEGSDGRFNIDTGDDVSIRGTVRRFAEARRGLTGLADPDRTALANGVYVAVERAQDVRGADARTEDGAMSGDSAAGASPDGL